MKFYLVYHILVILQLCFTHALETVYVVPESLLPVCDREPCITLSELARSSNIGSTTKKKLFIFMPGYHTLDSNISIFNTTEVSMISMTSNEYLSSQASITCQHSSGFSFENIGHVVIGNLTIIGCGNNKILSCDQLTVDGSTFIGRNGSGTALEVIETSAYITNSSFISNRGGSYRGPTSVSHLFAFVGGAVISNQSKIIIVNSLFEGNCAEMGGAIFLTGGSNVMVIGTCLANNSVERVDSLAFSFGGALYSENGNTMTNSSITLIECELYENRAHSKGLGGVAFMYNGIFSVNSSKFHNNMAYIAGVLFNVATQASIVNIYGSQFISNKASSTAGIMRLTGTGSTVTIQQSEFKNNTATFGGVIVMTTSAKGCNITVINSYFDTNIGGNQGGVLDSQAESTVIFIKCIFSNNRANKYAGGAINVGYTKMLTISGCKFINNSAVNNIGGAIFMQGAYITLDNTSFIENKAGYGGAIYISERSFVKFKNLCHLADNTANPSGGAIFAFDSTLQIYGNLEITSNSAYIGGGVMLFHSEVICQPIGTLIITKNKALKDGGGIYASNSQIIVLFDRGSQQHSAVNFTGNIADRWGGGIFLLMASSLHIEKKGEYNKIPTQADNIFYFISNSADHGGAIYVADETNYGTCSTFNLLTITSYCFIQNLILSPTDTLRAVYDIASIKFDHNRAVSSGSILYGGLLDRCTLRSDAEILKKIPTVYGFTYFQDISNIRHDDEFDTPWIISSLPVRVCFCQPNGKPNCSYEPDTLRIKKGERFNISLVAVDQANHTMGNTIIYSSLHYAESGLGDGQVIQIVKNYCSPLNFSIHSPHDNEILIFYPEGPCRNASKSLSMIKVKFSNCTCPIGFQVTLSEKSNCVCECDSRLLHSCITGCNTGNQTVTRNGISWISLLNDNHDYHREYLTYSYCPSDYCNLNPQINLNTINGSDVQCANHRTGILCGLCKPGLSLSLGSSRCVPCSRNWPVNFALILFAALVSGIAFVAIIMVLNLTVAIGTLNGLIFYANIIDSSKSIFYIPSCKVYSTLISWLNLDIGFDVCFYKGLGTYWKTWLQLVFPIYVISLVILIIILSRCSMRFSMLIAKKNPVATLATLILFSYTKVLRTVIVVLSKANLQYSNHPRELSVWLFDPTVKYGTGKHIPLFVVAVLILIVGAVYTFLLLAWQWLLKYVKYQKLCHFLDPYLAPYRFRYRYWTGLLLLARIAIYILIISYGHGNPNTNLLVIIFIVSFLLFLKGVIIHRLYKDWKIDIIETICYLNIILFSVAKIIILNMSNQRIYHDIATNTSGLITLLLLTYVLIQQLLTMSEICEQCWKKLKRRVRNINKIDREEDSRSVVNTPASGSGLAGDPQNSPKPTSSVIEQFTKSHESNKIVNASDSADYVELSDDDDDASGDSVSAPLLRKEIS